jgi:hypothetical protein
MSFQLILESGMNRRPHGSDNLDRTQIQIGLNWNAAELKRVVGADHQNVRLLLK